MSNATALEAALREVESHVADGGWDQPARLYALVPTVDLLAREPGLADVLGVDGDPLPDQLTPVEQDLAGADQRLERALERIEWPPAVAGCAVVLERLVLPPSADEALPVDDAEAAAYAHAHPERQEVRIAAGATRAGVAYSLLRLRSHDDAASVVGGTDLVPGLLHLLSATLTEES
jgi:hypothetical protein